jgi:hypothetical protein
MPQQVTSSLRSTRPSTVFAWSKIARGSRRSRRPTSSVRLRASTPSRVSPRQAPQRRSRPRPSEVLPPVQVGPDAGGRHQAVGAGQQQLVVAAPLAHEVAALVVASLALADVGDLPDQDLGAAVVDGVAQVPVAAQTRPAAGDLEAPSRVVSSCALGPLHLAHRRVGLTRAGPPARGVASDPARCGCPARAASARTVRNESASPRVNCRSQRQSLPEARSQAAGHLLQPPAAGGGGGRRRRRTSLAGPGHPRHERADRQPSSCACSRRRMSRGSLVAAAAPGASGAARGRCARPAAIAGQPLRREPCPVIEAPTSSEVELRRAGNPRPRRSRQPAVAASSESRSARKSGRRARSPRPQPS